ncbi:hypothetical protein Mapa_015656 [Marchantia paleacea]|nr:hypothetical protein Mapa_015656 [Marchantia paleacea]
MFFILKDKRTVSLLNCSIDSRLLTQLQVLERKEELAQFESMDCGKPIDEANWDMDDVSGCFEYYADLAEKLDDRQYSPVELPMEQFKSNVLREAMGVVALITPWNYPLLMATWKVAAALAAGCTAILKPSEMASVTCLELGAIAKEVGLPPGVLNIITGLGTAAGAPLSSHQGVDKVSTNCLLLLNSNRRQCCSVHSAFQRINSELLFEEMRRI